jgi:hypothetical protein
MEVKYQIPLKFQKVDENLSSIESEYKILFS